MSVNLGELACVVGEIDVGSHMDSMHLFDITCKIYNACPIGRLRAEDPLMKDVEKSA
jgi:hypothetical protein